jgi:hypothetical protein
MFRILSFWKLLYLCETKDRNRRSRNAFAAPAPKIWCGSFQLRLTQPCMKPRFKPYRQNCTSPLSLKRYLVEFLQGFYPCCFFILTASFECTTSLEDLSVCNWLHTTLDYAFCLTRKPGTVVLSKCGVGEGEGQGSRRGVGGSHANWEGGGGEERLICTHCSHQKYLKLEC